MKKYWTTKEGKQIFYKDLSTEHLTRIINFLERNSRVGVPATTKVFVDHGYDGDGYIPDFATVEFTLKGKEYLKHFDYKGLVKELSNREV